MSGSRFIIVTFHPINVDSLMPGYSSHPDPRSFNRQVWNIVSRIPAGRVATYGQIAAMFPPPGDMDIEAYVALSPRWVGAAMAACPEGIPWQRVVNAQGKVSQRPGADVQRLLLESEGVIFDEKDRIDLKKYGWRNRDESGTPKQALLY